nr:MAG TPA: hypothetical protein [Inoviridae sp.]
MQKLGASPPDTPLGKCSIMIKFLVWLELFLYYQDNRNRPRGSPTGCPAGSI